MNLSLSRTKIWTLGIGTALLIGGFASAAAAEGGSVIYSYERMAVAGEPENVLVPVADTDLRGELSKELLEQSFERLRRAKRSTYGNSYAEVSGRGADLRVEVHIARDNAQFAPIIIAESVYTLTEMGAEIVYFPGHAEEGLTRAEVPFSAFTLTVPLWKIVPETAVTTAQVRMPDGELLPVNSVVQQWRSDRDEIVSLVYSYLDSEEDILVRSVVRKLPELGTLRIDLITPLLAHDAAQVRAEVLGILEGEENNEAVLEAIAAALPEEPNSTLARQMAEFLGASSTQRFSVLLPLYLIENGSDEEAVEAVRSLRDWSDDARVIEALANALHDEREGLPQAAVGSLDDLSADEVRVAALDDEAVAGEVRTALAEDLAQESSNEAVRLVGLTYLANEREEGFANQTIAAIAGLSLDAARERVEGFLKDDARSKRLGAMTALLARGDVESVGALIEAAGESSDGETMRQAAYELMLAQPLNVITEQTSARIAEVQMVAYQAIGARAVRDGANASVISTVEAGTRHSSPQIRGASARALGELGGESSIERLGAMLDDRSPVVRRDVVLALGGASSSAYGDEIEARLTDSDAGVVAAAIDAMEMRNDQRASERIREMVSHSDPRVRASALRAVTTFIDRTDQNTVRQHMAMLSGAVNDEDPRVQLSALEQLGQFEERIAVTNIAILIGNDDVMIRSAAVRALGQTGHESAVRIVESSLGDPSPEVRREAIDALTQLSGQAARARLRDRLEREQDPQVRNYLQVKLDEI